MFNIYGLEQQIIEQMAITHVPGLAIAIVNGNDILYARGFGVTSVETGRFQ
jgi:CubicO group peptidase (beta-lactamase class C family)